MQVSSVSVFVVADPISVAVERSFTVFHLYPAALVTGFQFQVTWLGVVVFVPGVGEEGADIVLWARVVATEFPQGL